MGWLFGRRLFHRRFRRIDRSRVRPRISLFGRPFCSFFVHVGNISGRRKIIMGVPTSATSVSFRRGRLLPKRQCSVQHFSCEIRLNPSPPLDRNICGTICKRSPGCTQAASTETTGSSSRSSRPPGRRRGQRRQMGGKGRGRDGSYSSTCDLLFYRWRHY